MVISQGYIEAIQTNYWQTSERLETNPFLTFKVFKKRIVIERLANDRFLDG